MNSIIELNSDRWPEDLIDKNIAFALYRLPMTKEPVLVIQRSGEPKRLADFTQLQNEKGFVMAPFLISEDSPLIVIEPTDILEGWDNLEKGFDLNGDTTVCSLHSNMNTNDFQQYQDVFTKFSHALHQKEFEKLVLSRSKVCKVTGEYSLYALFKKACALYENAFVYLCFTQSGGVWIGSTPEILLSGKSGNYSTVALAGTMRISDPFIAYEWSKKNQQEQAIVSEYIRASLKTLGINPEEQGPFTATAGNLIHLKTIFEFSLSESSQVSELVSLLHPTPAVCGLPKKEAYTFIRKHEGYDRKYYSGFLGMIDAEGETNLYVNLRCMQLSSKEIRFFAGGGILCGSDAESEWNETEDKMQTMRSLFLH